MTDNKVFIDGVVEKYPEQLLDGRMTIEGNLLACLFEDPTLYDDIKQQIDVQNFITRDGRFLFGIVKLLREKKYSVIDEVTVLSNCTEEMKDRLTGIGGYKTIQNMASVVDLKNWEAILDAFNKSNILLRLHANGFNLFSEVTLTNGKRVKPFDLFSKANCDSNTVLAWYEEFISKLSVENSSESTKIIDEKFVDLMTRSSTAFRLAKRLAFLSQMPEKTSRETRSVCSRFCRETFLDLREGRRVLLQRIVDAERVR